MSGSLAGSTDPGAGRDLSARYILAFIAICAIEKAFACLATGFTGDEAYTLVIARSLALSYFDHPPLHQWILHGFVALSGESRWARAPFWLMFVAINAPLFGLTRRLFGAQAALWAMFAFNATTYFLVLPDGFIIPDAPSLLFLALAAWTIAEILFGPAEREGKAGKLWLAAGVALGCAGLAKYAALFAPIGLLGFLVGSPRHRHWLSDARPYLSAFVALLIFSPALLWNYQNHWVSLSFQSTRAATALTFGAGRCGTGRADRPAVAMDRRADRAGHGARDARRRQQRRTFSGLARCAARRFLRASAAARAAGDPALVQLRLAVRLSARRILAEREKRRLAEELGTRRCGARRGDGRLLYRCRRRWVFPAHRLRAGRPRRSHAIQLRLAHRERAAGLHRRR
jgi:hypothetical protein